MRCNKSMLYECSGFNIIRYYNFFFSRENFGRVGGDGGGYQNNVR